MIRHRPPQVALLVETSFAFGREILHGILRYERLHGPWDICLAPAGHQELKLPKMRETGKKGIIAHIISPRMSKEICNAQLPTVSIFPAIDVANVRKAVRRFADVHFDTKACGVMAAQYLLQCRFTHFGVFGKIDKVDWANLRVEAFSETIASHGYTTAVYPTLKFNERLRLVEPKPLIKWLKSLPKPVGVFVISDALARNVIETCQAANIKVPEDVAILGVDNDDLFCETTNPKISSIAVESERGGYEAARMLNDLMYGTKAVPAKTFGPQRVVVRRSSDVFLINDILVRQVVHFIRDNYASPITVHDVVKAMDVSRRQLEIRFKNELGYTIFDEIKKRRLQRARTLLLDTDLSLEEIAEICGFRNQYYLANVFRKEFGTTMKVFRRQNQ